MRAKLNQFEADRIQKAFPNAVIDGVYGQPHHNEAVGRQKQVGEGRLESIWTGRQLYVVIRRDACQLFSEDSGAFALPYALLGISGYMVYWMIAHGVFQALTALQAGR